MHAVVYDIHVNLALRPGNRSKRSVLLDAARIVAEHAVADVMKEAPIPDEVRVAIQISTPVAVVASPPAPEKGDG